MSYKPSLLKYSAIRNKNFISGKDTILLAKCYDDLYEVKEYIGLLREIGPKYYGDNGIVEVKIQFMNNEIYKTKVYLDSNITINSFVSIYGVFVETPTGEQELVCRGGMVKAHETLKQAGNVNTKYLYRFGIVQLSEVEKSLKFPKNVEGIEIVEEGKLWAFGSNNLKEFKQNIGKMLEEEKTMINLSQQNNFISINDGVSVPSLDETIRENETTQNQISDMNASV